MSFSTSCVHNYEPVIKSITADPNPVAPGGIVNLICNASDDDESSRLKEESLGYSWSAAYGEIISEKGFSGMQEMGNVMKELKTTHPNADMSEASSFVKELLS